MRTGYTSRENRRMKEKMPKCAVGTQRRHNPHIKVAAVAVVLFLQFHWQLGFACCSMWRMRNVCKSMKMLGNEEKLCCASCCEHFCFAVAASSSTCFSHRIFLTFSHSISFELQLRASVIGYRVFEGVCECAARVWSVRVHFICRCSSLILC